MEMNAPAPPNAIDENRNGLVGAAVDRVEGPLKVRGTAPYAHDVEEARKLAYGCIVEAAIGRGEIATIDAAAAENAAGVLRVMTHLNAPKQGERRVESGGERYARACPQLAGTRIAHWGQAVAFVVAETFEAARHAAGLVRVAYAPAEGDYDFGARLDAAEEPATLFGEAPDSIVGDFEVAFAAAEIALDATYTTPYHFHAQMEPHAAFALWRDGKLTVYCAAQLIAAARKSLAATLLVPEDDVRVVSRYVGGGFGGKLPINAEVILAAIAARELGRPVKCAQTRQQMFHLTTHRTPTSQRVRLGASADGRLTAIAHETWSHRARDDDFYEAASAQTRTLYAAPARLTRHRSVALDLPVSDSTRAPGEAVGLLALEQAMDELAEKLNMDPIELRLRNEPSQDPEKRIPFSTRHLVSCLRTGAERFGWSRRNPAPGSVREGNAYVGMGVAAAIRSNFLRPSQCRLALDGEGALTVQMAMTDIGTGSYTILAQIAAEMLGLPLERVRVELGDSALPPTPGSGGSWGAASAGSGLYDACMKLRAALAAKLGVPATEAVFAGGRVSAGDRGATLAELAGRRGLTAEGEIVPGGLEKQWSQYAYGAHFAEVAVDADTGEIRLRRMLGVFAAGRILNEKTARSQLQGAMIWGVGAALHEEGVVDARSGMFVTQDLVHYHVPAHADIPAVEAYFLPEIDDKTNPLKIKGLGELGICGAGAALANAVYNACGVRIRDYPLTLDKVLEGLVGRPSAA
ncbi:MAG: xanthine dehydrogenase family protein molybdopterin-binding subunit [Gammaproteobacteria bacterium]|nr:xanthine dehydrogenase family protein molybdopterin-binding subunit [Gammaproteobacteria bacterium]